MSTHDHDERQPVVAPPEEPEALKFMQEKREDLFTPEHYIILNKFAFIVSLFVKKGINSIIIDSHLACWYH